MASKEIPVLLLTGYLGSGKTTLLNRILSNKRGIKFAVIVNDLGEVNIDASLIERGGIVGKNDDSLVALQNGCICCTLKMDLVQQLRDIVSMQHFDYIVIEASGICEPEPIAQTITSMPSVYPQFCKDGYAKLDCIVTVVDAWRMQSEFKNGNDLLRPNIGEDDIENLVIQQIEFCNIVLLNKAAEVKPEELKRIKEIVHALNHNAKIIECNYGDVDLDKIINTRMFNFNKVATSATWLNELENNHDADEHHDEHHHEHEHEHHHHDHDEGEAEEYGIGTYVYYARPALDLNKFDDFVAHRWPKNIIRAKGICYFSEQPGTCYMFEQAGKQVNLTNVGLFYATMPKDQLEKQLASDPSLRRDWDEKYGDRMQKLVFIGQKLDKDLIKREIDACLVDDSFTKA